MTRVVRVADRKSRGDPPRAGTALVERHGLDALSVQARAPRVLVIEDDPRLMILLTMVLSGGGYAVAPLDSGLGAVALARALRPAAIVLDLGLPYRSGASLLAELKADPDIARIPVVVVSALVETLPEDRRALAAAVLPKPFSPRELLDVLGARTQQDTAC